MVEFLLINFVDDILPHKTDIFNASVIAIDTETTGIDPYTSKIRLIQLAVEGMPILVIDCLTFLPEGLPILKELMLGKAVKVFQNAKFDLKFLLSIDIPPPAILFDTMLAAQLLRTSGGPQRVGLEELARQYLGENISKECQKSDWRGILTRDQLEYAAKDAEVLLRLRKEMVSKIKENNLVEVARQEFACVRAIALVEYNGINFDINRWKDLREKIQMEQQFW